MAKSKVERYYDKHASQYSPGEFSPSNLAGDLYFADMITWHFFRKYVPKSKSCLILEAGAGTGDWAIQFAKLGYKNFVLADISQGMLKQAERKFAKLDGKVNVRYVKADIADMKTLDSNMFDYVFSQYDAVSFSLRPQEAMRELARVAKRHAYVIVTVDTKYRRVHKLIEARRLKEAAQVLKSNISYEYDDWHDFRFPSYNLTWEELTKYFEKAGLEVVEVIGAPVFMHHVNRRVQKRLRMNPKTRASLLRIELENCTNRSLANLAGHLQMVGRKN